MSETKITTLWNGTPRPAWAGQGVVEFDCVERAASYGDARDQMVLDQLDVAQVPQGPAGPCLGVGGSGRVLVPRPTRVHATVVPVSTRGHPMVDVAGRDLAYSGLHRGHVLAVSLGGLDVPENMVPQPGISNTAQVGCRPSPMETLKWRELEQAAAGLAMLGWERRLSRTQVPRRGDQVEYQPRGKGKAAITLYDRTGTTVKAGPYTVIYPSPAQYAQNSAAIVKLGTPVFTIELAFELMYRSDTRDNWPKSVHVRLTKDGNDELADIEYPWDLRIGDWAPEEHRQQVPIIKRRERKKEKLSADQLVATKLRRLAARQARIRNASLPDDDSMDLDD